MSAAALFAQRKREIRGGRLEWNRDTTADPSVNGSPQEIRLDGAERPVILRPCSARLSGICPCSVELQSRWTSQMFPHDASVHDRSKHQAFSVVVVFFA